MLVFPSFDEGGSCPPDTWAAGVALSLDSLALVVFATGAMLPRHHCLKAQNETDKPTGAEGRSGENENMEVGEEVDSKKKLHHRQKELVGSSITKNKRVHRFAAKCWRRAQREMAARAAKYRAKEDSRNRSQNEERRDGGAVQQRGQARLEVCS